MANPMKGEAEVRLKDGRTLTLVFDANAWIETEEVLGQKTQDILKELNDKKNPPGLKTQRAIIFGGLRKHHQEMTLFDAGDILVEAAEAMAKGLSGAMPQDGGEGDESDADPPTPRRGTGTKPSRPGRG